MNSSDHQCRVCVVGSINMDLIMETPRLPRGGETVLGGPFRASPGGKGANQAVAAARLRAHVVMIARVGADENGTSLRRSLTAEGVGLDAVSTDPAEATGVALITVAAGSTDGKGRGENTIVVAPGANSFLSPTDIDAARPVIANADVLLLQLESPLASVARAASIAKDQGVTVILNASPAAKIGHELGGLLDVVIVNEHEAATLLGEPCVTVADDPGTHEELCALVQRVGVPTVVITLGQRGAWMMHERASKLIAAYPVLAIDTVGAGDAFAGTFAARWAEHQVGGGVDASAVHDAACWACAAGALATTSRGALPSMPTRDRILKLLKSGPGY